MQPKVSVLIPNYNHSRFLLARINSVLEQTYQDFEIIIMDDKSTDNSVDIIKPFETHPKVSKVIYNKNNSGSTFKQWDKGIEEANGKYIWIAESDDLADRTMLKKLVETLDNNLSVGIAYCQSWRMDDVGETHGTWLFHTDDLDSERWKSDYVEDGKIEIEKYLIYKNTIPNASAVLFRKDIFLKVDKAFLEIEKCGDWYLWMSMLLISNVSFIAKPLNYFRFHSNSVIATAKYPSWYYDSIMRKLYSENLFDKADNKVKNIDAVNQRLLSENLGLLSIWQLKKKQILKSLKNLVIASVKPKLNGFFFKEFVYIILNQVKSQIKKRILNGKQNRL